MTTFITTKNFRHDHLTEAFQSGEKDRKAKPCFKLTQPWQQALTERLEKNKSFANPPPPRIVNAKVFFKILAKQIQSDIKKDTTPPPGRTSSNLRIVWC